ncbi:MAG TPA: hypothetical protein VMV86_01345 [Methanosarcinales archaeon]|nr:hypothetical protein [Methanosarcinales archaeon]
MSIEKQLEDMKKVAIMTGSLTDAHLLNLRNWIYILFADPEHEIIELDYNINGDEAHRNSGNYIKYTLKSKSKKQMPKKDVEKAMKTLGDWVATLLWKDMAIEISINGKEYTRKS